MKHAASIYLATTLAAFAGSPSSPQEAMSCPAAPSPWQVRAALYGWAQSLEGDVTAGGVNLPVDLGFDDIAEDLDMAVMGLIEVKHGRWGALLDVNYADISDSVATPAGIIAPSVDFNLKQWLVNGYVTYDAFSNDATAIGVFAGARFNSMELELGINNTAFSSEKSWIDPVVGFRFQQVLTEKLFVRVVGDIGGFGVSSDLTWQAMAGLGWRLNDTSNVLLGYRSIDTDYESGGFGYSLNAHGPVLGLEFTF